MLSHSNTHGPFKAANQVIEKKETPEGGHARGSSRRKDDDDDDEKGRTALGVRGV